MAKKCSWCGEQIGFFDIAYQEVKIGKKACWICGKCCGKIEHAKIGHTTFSEIMTEKTDPELYDYYIEPENTIQQQIKMESQQTNPLYDDIHQIAGDLRFIKNYLIFTIIFGIILGLVVACSSM